MKLFKLTDEPVNILYVLQHREWVPVAGEEEIDEYMSARGLIYIDYEYERRDPWPESLIQYYVSGVMQR
jgi:hypothetical protein